MEVYKDSLVGLDEFDFENLIPYFKDPIELKQDQNMKLYWMIYMIKFNIYLKIKEKYNTKFILNIIAHLSALSRIIEREIENSKIHIPIKDLESDVEINYIRN